jgi:4-hydroxybenzoate polyprenyltransferase
MSGSIDRHGRSRFADGTPAPPLPSPPQVIEAVTMAASRDRSRSRGLASGIVRGLRPAQWIKNGLVFAALVFGGKLLEPDAVARAVAAAIWFSLLSSGFYLINDVRDRHADRLHPVKRLRPVAAGELAPSSAFACGVLLVVGAIAGSASLGGGFLLVMLAYATLMTAYNLGLKQIVILDVFAIASGFALRAVGGAVAVDVSISPWLLVCTMLLALLLGFGKRRQELMSLDLAGRHRANLETYTGQMLDQAVAVAATGTLLAYAVYTFNSESVAFDHRMMVTIPIVAFGIFRYLFLVYGRGLGGEPETLLLTDRTLLGAVVTWGLASVVLFYLAS